MGRVKPVWLKMEGCDWMKIFKRCVRVENGIFEILMEFDWRVEDTFYPHSFLDLLAFVLPRQPFFIYLFFSIRLATLMRSMLIKTFYLFLLGIFMKK